MMNKNLDIMCTMNSEEYKAELEKLDAIVQKCHLSELGEILKDYGPPEQRILSNDLQKLYPMIDGKPFLKTLSARDLAAFSYGFTAPNFALAQTGTLCELHINTRERLISLIPETHIALVSETALMADHHQLFQQIPRNLNLTLISGPSRTADIEKRIVIGAHGPKKLIIILVSR